MSDNPIRTILIVDDEQSIVLHLRELLKGFGLRPIATTNPETVLSILDEEPVDLVLLDYHMGEVTGLDVLAKMQAHKRHRQIPAIFLTGETDEVTLGRCFDAGASDFVNKPVKSLELKARVNACLQIREERTKYRDLLLHVMPEEITEELLFNGNSQPRYHDQVTVGFTDFTNFTTLVADWPPDKVVDHLQFYFQKFDQIIASHGLTPIKTIGDSYMFAGGMFVGRNCHAIDSVNAAVELRDCCNQLKEEANIRAQWDVRIGLNTGPVVSGVISGRKIAHDIWGDTVNTAQRMEASGVPGLVQLSSSTFAHLPSNHPFNIKKSQIQAKGKGTLDTYLIE